MGLAKDAIKIHKKLRGKIEIKTKIQIKSLKVLSLLYTPGVAEISKKIFKNKELVYDYTSKWNSIAIVTDGSRVLGLGNVGPEAALPVMEGKALLFKLFGKVDAFPICLKTQVKEDIISTIQNISPSFGAINIEDIETPKVFEIVDYLNENLDIPVFHDDQHGSAVVTASALINASKLVDKELKEIRIVIVGAGSAGYGTVKLLNAIGIKNIIVTDSYGIIYEGRRENMNKYKEEIASITNSERIQGNLEKAMMGADVFIGFSGIPNLVNKKMISIMNKNPIIFALTNPIPEIYPEKAKKYGAKIVATGRSDYPNQINNSLAFPGILRGALDVRAKKINKEMLISATYRLASLVGEKLNENYIIPSMTERRIHFEIAKEVAKTAIKTKVARKKS